MMKSPRRAVLPALLAMLLPFARSTAAECVPCSDSKRQVTDLQGQIRKLNALKDANHQFLLKQGLSDSSVSKIQSNLLIIDLKLKTAANLLESETRKIPSACRGCDDSDSSRQGSG